MRALIARLLGRRRSRRRTADEPVYLSQIEQLSADDWRSVLAESPANAARWVYGAATYGDVGAQLYWAQMQLDGYGTARDPEGAFRWFGIAAKSGRADALNMLGRCHERGWGTPIDFALAAACYREAAEHSHDWAQFNLACLLLEGRGVARDPERSFGLFMAAVAQGHVKSMSMVGLCYENGWGRPRDLDAALGWYRRGAEGGDFRGQYCFGQVLLERGHFEDALRWLRLAVDNAPLELCRGLADQWLAHSEPRLQEMGARAQARVEAAGQ